MFLAEASSHRQAVEQFERVKALSPDYPGIHLRLAQALLKHRDFTNALAGALEVLRTEPKSPDALLVKGLALFETAQYREAIPPLTELLAMQSSNQAARLYRAQSRWKLNELEGARQDYEVVVQATPEAYPAYYALADIAYRNEDTPSAVRYSELFLGCAPPDLEETRAVKERLKELQQKQNRP
jgi:chemotaxis protein methyltransferase CheR